MAEILIMCVYVYGLSRGSDSPPLGGYVNFFKKGTPSPAQGVNNGAHHNPSLRMQDTTMMPEDVRAEHVLALRCFRKKLFDKDE